MISGNGIEANPEKMRALLEILPPSNIKQVQSLNGYLTSLRRFISRLAEMSLSFCQALKEAGRIKGILLTSACQEAFDSLKQYLSIPPILSRPVPEEPLCLCIAVGFESVSSCLLGKKDDKQFPVYYVSHVLRDAKIRYQTIEKVTYSVLLAIRKLRPSFQGPDIKVYTNYPLRKFLHKPDHCGRLVNWAVELSQFNITYSARTSIKGQVLADFLVECTVPETEALLTNLLQTASYLPRF